MFRSESKPTEVRGAKGGLKMAVRRMLNAVVVTVETYFTQFCKRDERWGCHDFDPSAQMLFALHNVPCVALADGAIWLIMCIRNVDETRIP